ncbi:unnamed protein product [Effrenium voratum]|uniref:EF-hand domain-containing protein n=1 Tax=Effrenium voratum TaxID=2562239 RepID=A0AA36I8V1_9DINO|nr:unnamed protein product [Effrenium voratum]
MAEAQVSNAFQELLVNLERQHFLELQQLREENIRLVDCNLKLVSWTSGVKTGVISGNHMARISEASATLSRMTGMDSEEPLHLGQEEHESPVAQEGDPFPVVDLRSVRRKSEDSSSKGQGEASAVFVVPTLSIGEQVVTGQNTDSLARSPSLLSQQAASFFESDTYELLIGALILCSVLILALEMQYEGYLIGHDLDYPRMDKNPQEVWHSIPEILTWIDRTFTGVFVLDIVLRVFFIGRAFFCQVFSVLDLVVVLCSLLEEVLGEAFPFDAPFLRLLRFAKVARALRVLKRAHFLGSLHILLKSVRASVEVLFWSLCLLGIIQCIAGMMLAQSVQGFLLDESKDMMIRREVFRYFGTFSSTLLTMFEVLMANWAPACRVLVDNVDEGYALGFVVYRCLVGFAILNVVSAVFLQQTMKVAAADQDVALQQRQLAAEAYTRKLQAFFKRLDQSGDGILTWAEFSAVLDSPKLQDWLATLDLESNDLVDLFSMMDDGDGEITLDDFLHGARSLRGAARSIDLASVLSTARRTEAKTEVLLTMLANISGFCKEDVKREARRLRSNASSGMRRPDSPLATPRPQGSRALSNWP